MVAFFICFFKMFCYNEKKLEITNTCKTRLMKNMLLKTVISGAGEKGTSKINK